MPNPVRTVITTGQLVLGNKKMIDAIFTPPAAATFLQGLVLGRLTADSKLVPYDPTGSDGEEIPRFVVNEDFTTSGTSDISLRVIEAAHVDSSVLHLDYTSPTALTALQLDLLVASSAITYEPRGNKSGTALES